MPFLLRRSVALVAVLSLSILCKPLELGCDTKKEGRFRFPQIAESFLPTPFRFVVKGLFVHAGLLAFSWLALLGELGRPKQGTSINQGPKKRRAVSSAVYRWALNDG